MKEKESYEGRKKEKGRSFIHHSALVRVGRYITLREMSNDPYQVSITTGIDSLMCSSRHDFGQTMRPEKIFE